MAMVYQRSHNLRNVSFRLELAIITRSKELRIREETMINPSHWLNRVTSGLIMFTGVFGIATFIRIFTISGFQKEVGIFGAIISLLPLLYILAGWWLWKGMRKGFILSVLMTGLALIDYESNTTSFFYANGIIINVSLYDESTSSTLIVDLWSSLIMLGLLGIFSQDNKVEQVGMRRREAESQ